MVICMLHSRTVHMERFQLINSTGEASYSAFTQLIAKCRHSVAAEKVIERDASAALL